VGGKCQADTKRLDVNSAPVEGGNGKEDKGEDKETSDQGKKRRDGLLAHRGKAGTSAASKLPTRTGGPNRYDDGKGSEWQRR